jgi:hypothetical protein
MSTLGLTTVGGTTQSLGDYQFACFDTTVAGGGTTSIISVYLDNSSSGSIHHCKVAMFSDNAGVPGARLAAGVVEISVPAGAGPAWFDATYIQALAGSTKYWLGFGIDTIMNFYYNTLAGQGGYKALAYASLLPDPFGVLDGTLNRQYSIYATYAASSSSTQQKHQSYYARIRSS